MLTVVFGSAKITLVTGLVRELTIAYTTGLIVLVHSKTQNGQKGRIGLACRSSAVLVYQRVGAPMESVIYQGEAHLKACEPVRVPWCGSRCCARLQSKGEHILDAGSRLGHRKAGVPLQRSLASKGRVRSSEPEAYLWACRHLHSGGEVRLVGRGSTGGLGSA